MTEFTELELSIINRLVQNEIDDWFDNWSIEAQEALKSIVSKTQGT
jgi:hypothetical protein